MGLQHQDIGVTVSVPATAAETVAKDNCFHPTKNYLEKLVWDGVERIANFAWRYLGAEDTHYHGAVSRCLFIAAVARIMRRKGGSNWRGGRKAMPPQDWGSEFVNYSQLWATEVLRMDFDAGACVRPEKQTIGRKDRPGRA